MQYVENRALVSVGTSCLGPSEALAQMHRVTPET
eukprot:CAMPEP_0197653456 /NCGR_PEP_ID=MMETSP1338-20131121/35583_1 /TAXON_ID=43686 ORGANISM="Pelagodinium beii, Strain RCC1491" /NCGR_SAMPLE_ID=MMETSP1338 /ASSEMBLY_ACC=CAM_ASM_000754 /LENGTH=33 /DNA_ID= /DNA_START= /DNA_END= /DNA_ORIENTATION=